jgi:hypothetical protein
VSDPYEEPRDADLRLDTTAVSANDAAELIMDRLESMGYRNASVAAAPSLVEDRPARQLDVL